MNINMEKLYMMVIRKELITRDRLENKGYTAEEIDYLIETNQLDIIDDELLFVDVEGLYRFGELLIARYSYKVATACFNRCLELNPHHRNSLLQSFLKAVKSNNFVIALKIFDTILTIEPQVYYDDNNLYAYLLSILEYVPEKYVDLVDESDIFEISLETDTKEVRLEKDIRRIITENRLTLAMSLLNDLIAQNPVYNVKRAVLKELLSKAIDNDNNLKRKINDLVNQGCYFELTKCLTNVKKRRHLDAKEYYILCLSKVLVDLVQTKEIPIITNLSPENIHGAIKGNNFKEAIKFNDQYLKDTKKDRETDLLRILLNKICELIEEIERTETLEEFEQSEIQLLEMDTINISENAIQEISVFDETKLNDILFVMKEQSISFEEAVVNYNLSIEESLVLKILMAKDCHSLGFESLTKKYLREVRLHPNATEAILSMIDEFELSIQATPDDIVRKRTNLQENKN